MLFPPKVKSTLWGTVDAMSCILTLFVKNPGKDFTRQRKLSFVQLIRFCICMESGCISHELLKYFSFAPGEAPTASAFIQQRAKLLSDAFRYLFGQFNLRFPTKRFMGNYSLIAADGSEFNIAHNPSAPPLSAQQAERQKGGSTQSIPSRYLTWSQKDI